MADQPQLWRSAVDAMHEAVTCPSCHGVLKDAVTMRCAHHYCYDCAVAMIDSNKGCHVCGDPAFVIDAKPNIILRKSAPLIQELLGLLNAIDAVGRKRKEHVQEHRRKILERQRVGGGGLLFMGDDGDGEDEEVGEGGAAASSSSLPATRAAAAAAGPSVRSSPGEPSSAAPSRGRASVTSSVSFAVPADAAGEDDEDENAVSSVSLGSSLASSPANNAPLQLLSTVSPIVSGSGAAAASSSGGRGTSPASVLSSALSKGSRGSTSGGSKAHRSVSFAVDVVSRGEDSDDDEASRGGISGARPSPVVALWRSGRPGSRDTSPANYDHPVAVDDTAAAAPASASASSSRAAVSHVVLDSASLSQEAGSAAAAAAAAACTLDEVAGPALPFALEDGASLPATLAFELPSLPVDDEGEEAGEAREEEEGAAGAAQVAPQAAMQDADDDSQRQEEGEAAAAVNTEEAAAALMQPDAEAPAAAPAATLEHGQASATASPSTVSHASASPSSSSAAAAATSSTASSTNSTATVPVSLPPSTAAATTGSASTASSSASSLTAASREGGSSKASSTATLPGRLSSGRSSAASSSVSSSSSSGGGGRSSVTSTSGTSTRSASSSGSASSRIVIAASNLESEHYDLIHRLVALPELRGRLEFTDDAESRKVTHLITTAAYAPPCAWVETPVPMTSDGASVALRPPVPAGASNGRYRLCRRTLKVLFAVTSGAWVLSTDWVKACLDKRALVDEGRYEVEGDGRFMAGPGTSRWRVANGQPPLFEGRRFVVHEPLGSGLTLKQLGDLLRRNGGAVVKEKDARSGEGAVVHIVGAAAWASKDLAALAGAVAPAPLLDQSWVLDSVSAQSPRPLAGAGYSAAEVNAKATAGAAAGKGK